MNSIRQVKNHLRSCYNNHPETKYLLAVSGGVDSMVLLDIFYRSMPTRNILVTYYHHDTPDDIWAEDEKRIVFDYCVRRGIKCYLGKSQRIESTKNYEQVCRKHRWNYLNNLARLLECSYVVTAHHLNDQAENVFIRLSRGESVDKIFMKEIINVDGINRFKPLLNLEKKVLEQYAAKGNIEFITDSTNYDQSHQRNYIRHSVLPLMMKHGNFLTAIRNSANRSI